MDSTWNRKKGSIKKGAAQEYSVTPQTIRTVLGIVEQRKTANPELAERIDNQISNQEAVLAKLVAIYDAAKSEKGTDDVNKYITRVMTDESGDRAS